ncbi:hypothetical protein CcI49_15880 [Frankia sp. CcI49]|uniref:hypothetical protein n=1 Tax=Frankia sp. CcI49 TaxID=1745382 RepID=UPI000975EDA7|nr:hypothetical protein [Frankia sp. CcI49]ONH59464.1 hypothetical protein CcI49_15880 [Frankia sp. CcI49]
MRLDENGRWVSDDGAYVWDETAQTWRLVNAAPRPDVPAAVPSASEGSAAGWRAEAARPVAGHAVGAAGSVAAAGESTAAFRARVADSASASPVTRMSIDAWTPPEAGPAVPAADRATPTGPIFTGEAYTGPTRTASPFTGYGSSTEARVGGSPAEVVGTNLVSPGPVGADPIQVDPVRVDPIRTDPIVRADSVVGADPTHTDPVRFDQMRGDQTRGDQTRGDQTRGDHARGVQGDSGPRRSDGAGADPARVGGDSTDPLPLPTASQSAAGGSAWAAPETARDPAENTDGIPRRTAPVRPTSTTGPDVRSDPASDPGDEWIPDADGWYGTSDTPGGRDPGDGREGRDRAAARRRGSRPRPVGVLDPNGDWEAGAEDGEPGFDGAVVGGVDPAPGLAGLTGRITAMLRRPTAIAIATAVVLVVALGVAGFVVLGGGDDKSTTATGSAVPEGRYDTTVRQTYIDACLGVSNGNERYCTCTLEKLEDKYSQEQYLAFSRDVESEDSQRIVREVYTACRTLR